MAMLWVLAQLGDDNVRLPARRPVTMTKVLNALSDARMVSLLLLLGVDGSLAFERTGLT